MTLLRPSASHLKSVLNMPRVQYLSQSSVHGSSECGPRHLFILYTRSHNALYLSNVYSFIFEKFITLIYEK